MKGYDLSSLIKWYMLVIICFACKPLSALPTAQGPDLYKRGVAASKRGEYAKATVLLKKAMIALPHWGIIQLELAKALHFSGAPTKEIKKAYTKATNSLPNSPRAFTRAALFWDGLGKAQQAIAYYKKALSLGDISKMNCLRASQLWLQLKQGRKAIPCLNTLQKRGSALFQTHFLLSKIFEQGQNISKASWHLQQAIAYKTSWLPLIRHALRFYNQFLNQQPQKIQTQWKGILRQLRQLRAQHDPDQPRRRLRPLLPSQK